MGGRQLIVLNPFLDSLGHFDLKNIGLPPGTGSGCFQSSQDIVIINLQLGVASGCVIENPRTLNKCQFFTHITISAGGDFSHLL